MCRPQKSDNRAKVRWSAPKFGGLTHQSPMDHGGSPKSKGQIQICKMNELVYHMLQFEWKRLGLNLFK